MQAEFPRFGKRRSDAPKHALRWGGVKKNTPKQQHPKTTPQNHTTPKKGEKKHPKTTTPQNHTPKPHHPKKNTPKQQHGTARRAGSSPLPVSEVCARHGQAERSELSRATCNLHKFTPPFNFPPDFF
jgi:hypothetical protein